VGRPVYPLGMHAMPRRLLPGAFVALALAIAAPAGQAAPGEARPAGPTATERAFIDRHWRRPLPPQGQPPSRFTPIERSLAPEGCGVCHPAQRADWSTSLHARSMGPGVMGQLVEMRPSDPPSYRICLGCHAPLAEQHPEVSGPRGFVRNPGFDGGLQMQGLVCSACHVRRHERFGPPRRPGAEAPAPPRQRLPHGGATRTTAFQRSEFCASCHQFEPDGFALNGKLLENTYDEWKASPAAREGRHCQHCHMPDRRHLWRGIHDPDMVRSGVTIALDTDHPRYRPGQELRATVTIANTGVGHHFPTYVTPQVVVRVELVDARGQPVPDTAEERVIGRQVPLDLSREIADTRIPAGGRFRLEYRRPVARAGLVLRVTVTVLPDEFYTRFFENLLETGAGSGEAQIREALARTRRSAFTIFARDLPLS
jgi:hypothetical protein